MKFRIQIMEVDHGATLDSPEGCDGYPHTIEPCYVADRGCFVLFVAWRVTPPPVPDAPPRAPKVRKAKLTK